MANRDPKAEGAYRAQVKQAQREVERIRPSGRLRATPLAGSGMKRTRWLWEGRIPRGELTLVAGREGTGKSTIVFDLAASLSRGVLPGQYTDDPQNVLVVATEDSFEHTITPRLVAAGADLAYIFRVDSIENQGVVLPYDLASLEEVAAETSAVLLVMDPLISRLGELDTHKDSDVRQALEPLVEIAGKTGMSVIGLIHHNKSGTGDPLNALMGSRAFAAVARSVLTASFDPDDESKQHRLLAHAKSSLGRHMPTLTYTIGEMQVGEDDGPIVGSRINWGDEDPRTAYDIAGADTAPKATKQKVSTEDWLEGILSEQPWIEMERVAMMAQLQVGVSVSTLNRAAKKLGVIKRKGGYQGGWLWGLKEDE